MPAPALVAAELTAWSAFRLAVMAPSEVGWAPLATCRMLIGDRLERLAESVLIVPVESAGQPSR